MKNDKNEWWKALGITTVIFIGLSLYLFLRRGYYDLYIINKVFGSTSVVLAGLTLVIGPLSGIFSGIKVFLNTRK